MIVQDEIPLVLLTLEFIEITQLSMAGISAAIVIDYSFVGANRSEEPQVLQDETIFLVRRGTNIALHVFKG